MTNFRALKCYFFYILLCIFHMGQGSFWEANSHPASLHMFRTVLSQNIHRVSKRLSHRTNPEPIVHMHYLTAISLRFVSILFFHLPTRTRLERCAISYVLPAKFIYIFSFCMMHFPAISPSVYEQNGSWLT